MRFSIHLAILEDLTGGLGPVVLSQTWSGGPIISGGLMSMTGYDKVSPSYYTSYNILH